MAEVFQCKTSTNHYFLLDSDGPAVFKKDSYKDNYQLLPGSRIRIEQNNNTIRFIHSGRSRHISLDNPYHCRAIYHQTYQFDFNQNGEGTLKISSHYSHFVHHHAPTTRISTSERPMLINLWCHQL